MRARQQDETRAVPVQFTLTAEQNLRDLPEIANLAKAKARQLSLPGAAPQLGHQCKGALKRCRTIKLGAHHRLVFMVRPHDVVVLAIWKRRDLAVYDVAERALLSGLPPAPSVRITNVTKNPIENAEATPRRRSASKETERRRGRQR